MSVPATSARIPIKRERPIRTPELDVEMPNSESAEMAILGSILTVNAAYYRVADISTDDFFWERNKVVYAAIALMVAEGQEDIEILTLKEHLIKQGRLEAAGGVVYLSSLLDYWNAAQIEKYAAIVKRASKKRALIVAGNALMRHALEAENEPEESASLALSAIGSGASTSDASQARPLVDVLAEAFEAQKMLAENGASEALDCDWPTLNKRAVFYSTFVLCTADRGVGKSALMRQWARNLAGNSYPTAMLSLESSPRQLALRHGSAETGIQHNRMRDWRTFNAEDHAKTSECLRVTAKLPLFVARGPRTFEQIVLEIRRLKAVHAIRAVYLDYIQLIRTDRRFDRDELKYAHFADELLGLAIDLDVMICAFSQVNKEGGVAYADSIEKSARVRIHLERPHKMENRYGPDGNCYVDVSILKNNEGATGSFEAHFDELHQRWAEGTCAEIGHGTQPLTSKLF